jgi:hypothetical protein
MDQLELKAAYERQNRREEQCPYKVGTREYEYWEKQKVKQESEEEYQNRFVECYHAANITLKGGLKLETATGGDDALLLLINTCRQRFVFSQLTPNNVRLVAIELFGRDLDPVNSDEEEEIVRTQAYVAAEHDGTSAVDVRRKLRIPRLTNYPVGVNPVRAKEGFNSDIDPKLVRKAGDRVRDPETLPQTNPNQRADDKKAYLESLRKELGAEKFKKLMESKPYDGRA